MKTGRADDRVGRMRSETNPNLPVPARFIIGNDWPDGAPTKRAVWLHGSDDDHLRLIVLLASKLEADTNRDIANACRQRNATWSDRHSAFDHLLQTVSPGHIILVGDVDALTGGASSGDTTVQWDDHTFSRQKRQTLDCMMRSVGRIDWWFLRPAPTSETDNIVVPREDTTIKPLHTPSLNKDYESAHRAIESLIPAVRPLASGLLTTGTLDPWSLTLLIEHTEPEVRASAIVQTAYDVLPLTHRDTVRRISAQRGPYLCNGKHGNFNFDNNDPDEGMSVDGDTIQHLRRAGWILGPASSTHMARPVRAFLQTMEDIADPGRFRRVHHWLCRRIPLADVNQTAEAHHHAVLGLDTARAVESALYYGADLRATARAFSLDGHYEEAWTLYSQIVESFDRDDAYAWEYLAYNLDRANGPRDKILAAYERAAALEPTNPLYKGRLIGYHSRLGQDVRERFDEEMSRLAMTGDIRAIGYLAKPVFDALVQKRRWEDCRLLTRRWGFLLSKNEHLRCHYQGRQWWQDQ